FFIRKSSVLSGSPVALLGIPSRRWREGSGSASWLGAGRANTPASVRVARTRRSNRFIGAFLWRWPPMPGGVCGHSNQGRPPTPQVFPPRLAARSPAPVVGPADVRAARQGEDDRQQD